MLWFVTDATAILELNQAWVRLGANDALRGVDFKIAPGEFVVLLGPNGSGKTTLVKALLGLLELTKGECRAFGRPLHEFEMWDQIGYVPQRLSASTGIPATVQEVVLSGRIGKIGLLSRFGREDQEAVERALDLVDLSEFGPREVDRLSGGQQQRVLIARALATDPAVLVMDEPVASVDLAHQESFADTLSELSAGGTSILLVAHSLGAMQELAQRAVVLEGGVVVHDGAPSGAFLHAHDHPHHPLHPNNGGVS
jgi:zinc transport system ATP-binding protein